MRNSDRNGWRLASAATNGIEGALAGCLQRSPKRKGSAYCAEPLVSGAAARNRTEDLMITNQALYQLSYSSTWARIIGPPYRVVELLRRQFSGQLIRFSNSGDALITKGVMRGNTYLSGHAARRR
jgi:hypothetical protein